MVFKGQRKQSSEGISETFSLLFYILSSSSIELESEHPAQDLNLLVLPRVHVLLVETLELRVDLHAVHLAEHGPLPDLGSLGQGEDRRLTLLLVFAEKKRRRKIG